MLSVRLPEELENSLERLAEITNRPKSFYIKEALEKYMEEMEDVYISLERIVNPKRELYTTEEVLREIEKE